MWGSVMMIRDIEELTPAAWTDPADSPTPAWMGAFTRLEVLIAVGGCFGE